VRASSTIWVLKRNETIEAFDRQKFRGCLFRALRGGRRDAHWAGALAHAVECFLRRRRVRCLSSAAVLEMAVVALASVGRTASARNLEARHAARLKMRQRLTVRHGSGVRTAWSKDWLVRRAAAEWGLGRTGARVLAGQIEQNLIARDGREVSRARVVQMLAQYVSAYGLTSRQATAGAEADDAPARQAPRPV